MEPVVIDEAILETYQNFIEFQPTVNHLIEVICFQRGLDTINTFDIFRGMVDEDSSTVAIVLNTPVTKVSVVDGITTAFGPATPDDGIVMLHEDDYDNIYWKDHTPPIILLPKRKQETVSETIKNPKPERTAEQAVRTLEFGGRKTKRRKTKRKSRRKNRGY